MTLVLLFCSLSDFFSVLTFFRLLTHFVFEVTYSYVFDAPTLVLCGIP